MPIPPGEFPVRTIVLIFPPLSFVLNTPQTSSEISIPVGIKTIEARIDGSAWTSGTKFKIVIEVSLNNGGSWRMSRTIIVSKSDLVGDIYKIGTVFPIGGNNNSQYKIRVTGTVIAGVGLILVGDVSTT